MNGQGPQEATEKCIRCDEVVPVDVDALGHSHVQLPFHQEEGALPICMDCFEEVKPRDVWN